MSSEDIAKVLAAVFGGLFTFLGKGLWDYLKGRQANSPETLLYQQLKSEIADLKADITAERAANAELASQLHKTLVEFERMQVEFKVLKMENETLKSKLIGNV